MNTTTLSNQTLLVPTSPGELIDKITILEIKAERIIDSIKLANVRAELGILQETRSAHLVVSPELERLTSDLKEVNVALWDIEDWIRDEERVGRFGERFIELARSVYVQNDKRAALKKEINLLLGSKIVEEKSYQAY